MINSTSTSLWNMERNLVKVFSQRMKEKRNNVGPRIEMLMLIDQRLAQMWHNGRRNNHSKHLKLLSLIS